MERIVKWTECYLFTYSSLEKFANVAHLAWLSSTINLRLKLQSKDLLLVAFWQNKPLS